MTTTNETKTKTDANLSKKISDTKGNSNDEENTTSASPSTTSDPTTYITENNETSSITIPSQDSNMTTVAVNPQVVAMVSLFKRELDGSWGPIENETNEESMEDDQKIKDHENIDHENIVINGDEDKSDQELGYQQKVRMSLPPQSYKNSIETTDKRRSMDPSLLSSSNTVNNNKHLSIASSLQAPDLDNDRHISLSSSLIAHPPSLDFEEDDEDEDDEDEDEDDDNDMKDDPCKDKKGKQKEFKDSFENFDQEEEFRNCNVSDSSNYSTSLNSFSFESITDRPSSNTECQINSALSKKILVSTNSYHNSINHWNSSVAKPEVSFETTMSGMANSISDAFSLTQAAISNAIANSSALRESFINEIKKNSISTILETKSLIINNNILNNNDPIKDDKIKSGNYRTNEENENDSENNNSNNDDNDNNDDDDDDDDDDDENNDNNDGNNGNGIVSHIAATHQFFKNVIKTMEDCLIDDVTDDGDEKEIDDIIDEDSNTDQYLGIPSDSCSTNNENNKTLLTLLEEEETNKKDKEVKVKKEIDESSESESSEYKSDHMKGILTPKSMASPQAKPIPITKIPSMNMYISPSNSIRLEDLEDDEEKVDEIDDHIDTGNKRKNRHSLQRFYTSREIDLSQPNKQQKIINSHIPETASSSSSFSSFSSLSELENKLKTYHSSSANNNILL